MQDNQSPSEEVADPPIRMLYEFYTTQRVKAPGSIYATYLLNGVPKAPKQSYVNGHHQDGEDTHMQSSPYTSSPVPYRNEQDEAAPSRTVVLVKEDDLEGKTSLRLRALVYFTASEMSAAE